MKQRNKSALEANSDKTMVPSSTDDEDDLDIIERKPKKKSVKDESSQSEYTL